MNGSINHLTNLVWKYIFNQLSIFIKPEAAYGGGRTMTPPFWKIGGPPPSLENWGDVSPPEKIWSARRENRHLLAI